MRAWIASWALFCCFAASGQTPDGLFRGAPTLERAALVAAVLERNPGVEAALAALAAARAAQPLAALRDDPTVSYRMAPASLGAGMRFGQELEISQLLPYPHRQELKGKVASAEVDVKGFELAKVELELAAEAQRLHSEYYLIERELELSRQHQGLLEDLKQVATARYATGLGRQNEPLSAEVELGHLHHRVIELESHRAIARAALNVLLDRDLEAPLPTPADPPWTLAAHSDLEDAADRAVLGRPELAILTAELNRLEQEMELARLWHRPDLELMASYSSMWDDREHRFMLGVAVSLPVSKTRRSARVAELEARRIAMLAERRKLQRQIRFEVFSAVAQWREAIHHLELYDSQLLPAARDESRASLASYRSGKGEVMEVIESERRLREVELGRFEALAELAASRAKLDGAIGQGVTP